MSERNNEQTRSFATIVVGGAKKGEDITGRTRLDLTQPLDVDVRLLEQAVHDLHEWPIAVYPFKGQADGKRIPTGAGNLPNISRDILERVGAIHDTSTIQFETYELLSPDESIPEPFTATQIAIASLGYSDRIVVARTVRLRDNYHAPRPISRY